MKRYAIRKMAGWILRLLPKPTPMADVHQLVFLSQSGRLRDEGDAPAWTREARAAR